MVKLLHKSEGHYIKSVKKDDYIEYLMIQGERSKLLMIDNKIFQDINILRQILPEFILDHQSNILDIGCKNSAKIVKYFHYQGFVNCYGIDIAESCLLSWNELFSSNMELLYKLKIADVQINIPFSVKFKLITLSHVLEHCYKPEKALMNCKKVLQKSGLLHIQVPLSPLENFLAWDPHYSYWNDKKIFFAYLKKCGFETIYYEEGRDPNAEELMVFAKAI